MRPISKIVIHYTDSPDVSADTIRRWHKARRWRDIGYHRVIRKDGSIELGRPDSQGGAHTRGHNLESLGVVLTGTNRLEWYPSSAQITSLKKLVSEWQHKYNIADDHVYLHRQLNSTSCPGRLTLAHLKKRRAMQQTGKRIGWPSVTSTDKVIVGNPHPSKTIKVMVRKNGNKPYPLWVGPTAYQSIVGFSGYLNLRSRAVIDSELRLA